MNAVTVERRDGIGWITLNAVERRNALDLSAARNLADAAVSLGHDPQVHALVITGKGSVFCAGADRAVLAAADEVALRAIYDSFLAVRQSPVPTVAAVNGPAIGAGFNLALACDVRLAARSASFESRFLQLPIHPGGGHTWMLARLVGPAAAAAMCVFDQPVSGVDAVRMGLAWDCVADDDLLTRAASFCDRLATSPSPSLARTIKETLSRTASQLSFEQSLELELERQIASTRDPLFVARLGRRHQA